MAAPKSHILLLGHSFFRRLRDAACSSVYPAIRQNFGLRNREIHFVCRGGWTVSNLEMIISQVRNSAPNVQFSAAIIQMGGNDLSPSCEPLELASKLEDLAQCLRDKLLIPTVFICEIFIRPSPRGISVAEYERKRLATMNYLATLLDNNAELRIWKHRRIFNSPNNMFLADGTHLNPTGLKKFYESIKLAIILATTLP